MTKKFEKAKVETIEKCNRVLNAVRLAMEEELGTCGFCWGYGHGMGCGKCPIDGLCGGKLHVEVEELLKDVEEKVVEGISLLEKVKE